MDYTKIIEQIEGFGFVIHTICQKDIHSPVLLLFNKQNQLVAEYCRVNQHLMFKKKRKVIKYNEELVVWRRK